MISEPSGATVKLSGCDFGSVVTTSLGSAACAAEQTSSAASDRTESRKLAFAGATTKARTADKTVDGRLFFTRSSNGICLSLLLWPVGIGSWAQFASHWRFQIFKR